MTWTSESLLRPSRGLILIGGLSAGAAWAQSSGPAPSSSVQDEAGQPGATPETASPDADRLQQGDQTSPLAAGKAEPNEQAESKEGVEQETKGPRSPAASSSRAAGTPTRRGRTSTTSSRAWSSPPCSGARPASGPAATSRSVRAPPARAFGTWEERPCRCLLHARPWLRALSASRASGSSDTATIRAITGRR